MRARCPQSGTDLDALYIRAPRRQCCPTGACKNVFDALEMAVFSRICLEIAIWF
jgi:hypothetical protein